METYSRHPQFEQQIQETLAQFSASGLIVLSGPSGVGKSHLAEWIHRHGPTANQPFLIQDAAGLVEGRFESQLFGHVRGAFSGAVSSFAGLVGAAGQGTLLIEAIEDLSRANQARLLRFIQERMFRPVGGTLETRFEGRLIFTSRLGLVGLRDQNLLRDDFYYRLAGRELLVWELAERPFDFIDLAHGLVARLRKELPPACRWPELAEIEALAPRSFQGNLHGLYNVLQRAALQDIDPCLIPLEEQDYGGSLPKTGSFKDDLHLLEGRLLKRALRENEGTRDELAARLGISTRSLMYKLKEHQLN